MFSDVPSPFMFYDYYNIVINVTDSDFVYSTNCHIWTKAAAEMSSANNLLCRDWKGKKIIIIIANNFFVWQHSDI